MQATRQTHRPGFCLVRFHPRLQNDRTASLEACQEEPTDFVHLADVAHAKLQRQLSVLQRGAAGTLQAPQVRCHEVPTNRHPALSLMDADTDIGH